MAEIAEKYTKSYAYLFEDREVQKPLTFDIKNNDTQEIFNATLTSTPGTIINEGTPINSTVMNEFQKAMLDLVYPIGRGFIDFTEIDYSNYLGFTWERELVGMIPIGLNIDDTDFNVVGKTGGSKTHTQTADEMPYHTHRIAAGRAQTDLYTTGANNNQIISGYAYNNGNFNYTYANGMVTSSVGSGQAMNIMNPYKVVSYWKRVS